MCRATHEDCQKECWPLICLGNVLVVIALLVAFHYSTEFMWQGIDLKKMTQSLNSEPIYEDVCKVVVADRLKTNFLKSCGRYGRGSQRIDLQMITTTVNGTCPSTSILVPSNTKTSRAECFKKGKSRGMGEVPYVPYPEGNGSKGQNPQVDDLIHCWVSTSCRYYWFEDPNSWTPWDLKIVFGLGIVCVILSCCCCFGCVYWAGFTLANACKEDKDIVVIEFN